MRIKLSDLRRIIKEEVKAVKEAMDGENTQTLITGMEDDAAITACMDFLGNVESRSKGLAGDLIYMVIRKLGGSRGLPPVEGQNDDHLKWSKAEFDKMMGEYFGPRNIGVTHEDRPEKFATGQQILDLLDNNDNLRRDALRILGSNPTTPDKAKGIKGY